MRVLRVGVLLLALASCSSLSSGDPEEYVDSSLYRGRREEPAQVAKPNPSAQVPQPLAKVAVKQPVQQQVQATSTATAPIASNNAPGVDYPVTIPTRKNGTPLPAWRKGWPCDYPDQGCGEKKAVLQERMMEAAKVKALQAAHDLKEEEKVEKKKAEEKQEKEAVEKKKREEAEAKPVRPPPSPKLRSSTTLRKVIVLTLASLLSRPALRHSPPSDPQPTCDSADSKLALPTHMIRFTYYLAHPTRSHFAPNPVPSLPSV